MQTDIKTASEIYLQLGITELFKVWIAKQPGFDVFESFYGKFPDGKLGKDYRLKPEQAALLLSSLMVLPKTKKHTKKAPRPQSPQRRFAVIIEGQNTVYWYVTSLGLCLHVRVLDLLGREASERQWQIIDYRLSNNRRKIDL